MPVLSFLLPKRAVGARWGRGWVAGVGGTEKGREGRGRGLHVRGLSQGLGPGPRRAGRDGASVGVEQVHEPLMPARHLIDNLSDIINCIFPKFNIARRGNHFAW